MMALTLVEQPLQEPPLLAKAEDLEAVALFLLSPTLLLVQSHITQAEELFSKLEILLLAVVLHTF
jgi:hypothetical protein